MITRDQPYVADEVFNTGTAAEIVGVRMIDHRRGGGKPGPITCKILEAFQDNAHGNGKHSADWLDYIVASEISQAEKVLIDLNVTFPDESASEH
jgi:branched-chain amino acid aminotransferase